MSSQHQNKIDYTKMHKSSRNNIDYCPRCGRKGKVRKYAYGYTLYIHKSIFKGAGYETEDYCYIEAPESN